MNFIMKKVQLHVVAGLMLFGFSLVAITICGAKEGDRAPASFDIRKIQEGKIKNSRIDLRMIVASELPKIPYIKGERDVCGIEIKPQTEAGKKISSLGWSVTAEQKIAAYQVVAFAGKIDREIVYCVASYGYIGIYDKTTLVGLVHGVPATKSTVVSVVPLENGGLRIWGKQILNEPLADLVLRGDGQLHLEPLADKETFCQGRVMVPNIYFQPIDKARKKLIAANWIPKKIENNNEWWKKSFLKHGIIEAKDCAGTEFGYCWFEYVNSKNLLSVVTAGEDAMPKVAEYKVTCDSP
jgi:hypothetical protein